MVSVITKFFTGATHNLGGGGVEEGGKFAFSAIHICRGLKSVFYHVDELPPLGYTVEPPPPYGHLILTATFVCPGETPIHFLIRKKKPLMWPTR